MEAFKKVVRIGTLAFAPRHSLFVCIKYDGKRLSIAGVEGPKRNGDCVGACGQVVMSAWEIEKYAPGWDAAAENKLRSVWGRWHMNDMRAGSPAQSEHLRNHPVTDRTDYYASACATLREAGLHPDPNYLHQGEPYAYGSAWLFEEIPEEVLEWLHNLPETDVQPAWV